MRLTVDVILRAQVSINPLKQRELNLRGYKAPAIENLGVTKDGFDCIDLSDNEIKKLENFPRLRRLRMLLLNNNHVAKIHEGLADSIENLEYLILTGNRVTLLAEVGRLAVLPNLDTLSLMGNPVTKRKYYRQYVIHKLPHLRVLDFQKVKPREREAASVFFNSLAGKRIEEEAEAEAKGLPLPPVASVTALPPPPPPAAAMNLAAPPPSPASQQQVKSKTAPGPVSVPAPAPSAVGPPPPTGKRNPSPVKASKTTVAADVPMEVSSPVKQHGAPLPVESNLSTPSKPAKPDVEMEEVPYTPSKPIEQLTVNQLREALKGRGLPTKGLKAELVKRLKEAVGAV